MAEDIERRLGELERQFSELKAGQQWLRDTLVNVMSRQQEIADRTQILLQRFDQAETFDRGLQREVRELSGKIDALGQLDGKLDVVVAALSAPPVLALAARAKRRRG